MGLGNLTNGMKWGTGLAVGAAAVLLAPIILPVAGGVLKSLAKAGIKGGIILYEKGKLMVEETKETLEDLTAEAKSELAGEQAAPVAKAKKAVTTT
ncbi:DUF5132 domain-containing protein [Desulfatiglans anilini]|uniref:DUF5132 domain-containing protein n=1 Tax=Desulfatiglans anilini TaxID=90728 RepID=UPI0004137255|nr:DUF5132 domain-containing protein [Desulfatiglans anilini]